MGSLWCEILNALSASLYQVFLYINAYLYSLFFMPSVFIVSRLEYNIMFILSLPWEIPVSLCNDSQVANVW
jgi:hypothetical protein